MNEETIVNIGTIIIALIGAIITYIVVPFLKQKTTKEQREDILFWVKFAVKAAEQMKEAGIIAVPKKEYVINFLREIGISITDKELDILIEAAVFEMNNIYLANG